MPIPCCSSPRTCQANLTLYNGGYGAGSCRIPWKVGLELELGQTPARVAGQLYYDLVTAAGSGSDHAMAPKRNFSTFEPPLAKSEPSGQMRRLQRPCKAQNPSVVTLPQTGAGVSLMVEYIGHTRTAAEAAARAAAPQHYQHRSYGPGYLYPASSDMVFDFKLSATCQIRTSRAPAGCLCCCGTASNQQLA
jgi:hypothetical protein